MALPSLPARGFRRNHVQVLLMRGVSERHAEPDGRVEVEAWVCDEQLVVTDFLCHTDNVRRVLLNFF